MVKKLIKMSKKYYTSYNNAWDDFNYGGLYHLLLIC